MLTKLPNILTVSRIVAIPVILGIMFMPPPLGNWLALAVYIYAAVTDILDGYLARIWSQQSNFGRFLDPIADKLLIASLLLMLVGIDRIGGLTILPAAVILCREILVSGLREFLAEVRVGLPVSSMSKIKTFIQILALGFLIVGDVGPDFWGVPTLDIGIYGLWAAAVITLVTGYDYLVAGLGHIAKSDAEDAGA